MEPPGHGSVGWSILYAIARSQLRRGRSVVLDGVARAAEIDTGEHLALDENAAFVVVFVECPDPVVHRCGSRVGTAGYRTGTNSLGMMSSSQGLNGALLITLI